MLVLQEDQPWQITLTFALERCLQFPVTGRWFAGGELLEDGLMFSKKVVGFQVQLESVVDKLAP